MVSRGKTMEDIVSWVDLNSFTLLQTKTKMVLEKLKPFFKS